MSSDRIWNITYIYVCISEIRISNYTDLLIFALIHFNVVARAIFRLYDIYLMCTKHNIFQKYTYCILHGAFQQMKYIKSLFAVDCWHIYKGRGTRFLIVSVYNAYIHVSLYKYNTLNDKIFYSLQYV